MEKKVDPGTNSLTFEQSLELEKLKIEKIQARNELIKWALIAVGAIISFYIIDLGKLRIEKFTAESTSQENLLNSYLSATDSPDPDLWKRKLSLLQRFSKDTMIISWAQGQEDYINQKAALLALYKETVNVASVVANRQIFDTEDWQKASKRYYQLYWADLPFYEESQPVISAMIDFKSKLDKIQSKDEAENWAQMNYALISLSRTLKAESDTLNKSEIK